MSTMTRIQENKANDHSISKFAIIAFLGLLLISLLSVTASAQVLYGTLVGNVTDPSGAVVPNAKVDALNVQTGATHSANTDSAGSYRIPDLQQGTYKVTVSVSGFTTVILQNVAVTVNDVKRADAQLQVAQAQTTVEVNASQELLQTDKADVRTNLSATQIADLPTAGSQGRNFQSLLRLIPGAGLTAETNSLAGNPQRAINANFNGQSQQQVNTRIDGAQNSYPWLPSNVAYVPPSDAIETVNVVTNSFDAEQGMAGGAAVNVQVKSGTNKYHGLASWFHTDQNFAARNYFQTDTSIPAFAHKNRNNQNQFGGQFGGPILKDKLFFFLDYERTTQRQKAGPDTRTLPTAAMATGDFRNLPGNPVIFDPATGDQHGANKQQISCNGVLNVICPNRIDPAAAALAKLLQPDIAQEFSTSNGLNNFAGSGTALFNRDNVDGKVDYNISDRSSVFGRYSFSKTLVFDPPLLGAAIGDATNGGQLGDAPGLVQSVGLGAKHIFSPTLLLDWNFGFTRQRLGSTFDLVSANGLNDLKIPGTNNAGTPGDPNLYFGYPGFTFTATGNNGAALGNAQPANPFLFRDQQFVTGANLSWTTGKHNLRGGVEWNHSQLNHFQPQGGTFQNPRGSFQFNGDATALQNTSTTWFNSWADFMLGLPSATGKAYPTFNPNALRWSQWAWYIRDQYQLTPKLTVNLGVRWEYYPFGYSDNGKGLRYLNLATGSVLVGGYGNIPQDDGIDTGHGQFLPRVGLAYRLTEHTVIRAGYGMSADPNNWRYFRNAYPANIIVNNVVPTGTDFIPVASLTGLNGTGLGSGAYSVPTGIVLSPLPNLSSGVVPLPTNASTTTIPNPFRRGYINSYNLMIQHEIKGYVVETGFVGTSAIRPLVNMNANASPVGTGQAGGLLSTAFGQTYTGTINEEAPFKNNYYDSLQSRVTKHFGASTFGLAWTWSKAINYADNEDLGFLLFPYPAYWNKNKALASYDRTHNIEAYGVVQLPFGKGQRWLQSGVGNWLLGGWQISPIISRLSGVPFTVTAAGGPLNANGSTQTADLVGQFVLTGGKPPRTGATCAANDPTCHYFLPSAFAAPLITSNANAHFGTSNRNEFRGPGYFNMNLSIAREFRLTERFKLQIRADAFSFTNTPHFANPQISCGGSGTTSGPVSGSGGLCETVNSAGNSANNFGVVTGTAQPGGFFGPDPGNRSIWLGTRVIF